MIIGVTGFIASGKSVLSEVLAAKGFTRLTLSEEVREEARKLGIEIERNALQDLGNKMRSMHGNDYWAKRLIAKIEDGKNYIVEGIRNPGEIETLRKLNSFVLIGVSAPAEQRLEWIKKRKKDSDPKTIEGIKAIDSRDRGIGEHSTGQQTELCYQMADSYIVNDAGLDDLRKQVEKLLEELTL